jgi:chitodextrinase
MHAVALAAALLLAVPAAFAAGLDRKVPTAPTNLTVTGTTAYSVSLAWTPPRTAPATYRIVNINWGQSEIIPGTQTTFTYARNLSPLQTYSFHVYAVDAAGNFSKPSNAVSASLPRDTTTPSAPQVTLTEAGQTHLTLAWTTQDDDPTPIYLVFMNGLVLKSGSPDAAIVVAPLPHEMTCTFAVQARDSGGNWSPVSAALTATTLPRDLSDTTPPTTPALTGYVIDGACEVILSFASTDDITPPEFIAYRIYLNGVHIDTTTLGYTQVFEYGNVDGPNTFEVVAVDEAGNASAPAAVTLDLIGCVGTPL